MKDRRQLLRRKRTTRVYDGCDRYDERWTGQEARRSQTNFKTKANDTCLRRMRTIRWTKSTKGKEHEDPRHVNDGPNTNLRRKRTTRVYDGYIIEESSSREINMLRLAQSSTERSNAQESPAQKGPERSKTRL